MGEISKSLDQLRRYYTNDLITYPIVNYITKTQSNDVLEVSCNVQHRYTDNKFYSGKSFYSSGIGVENVAERVLWYVNDGLGIGKDADLRVSRTVFGSKVDKDGYEWIAYNKDGNPYLGKTRLEAVEAALENSPENMLRKLGVDFETRITDSVYGFSAEYTLTSSFLDKPLVGENRDKLLSELLKKVVDKKNEVEIKKEKTPLHPGYKSLEDQLKSLAKKSGCVNYDIFYDGNYYVIQMTETRTRTDGKKENFYHEEIVDKDLDKAILKAIEQVTAIIGHNEKEKLEEEVVKKLKETGVDFAFSESGPDDGFKVYQCLIDGDRDSFFYGNDKLVVLSSLLEYVNSNLETILESQKIAKSSKVRKETRRSWDSYFMEIAESISTRSIDPVTKHGTVIVDEDKNIVATGCNGPIAGINDSKVPLTRPEKYFHLIHSEINAILRARRDISGMTVYITGEPCVQCLLILAQAGISKIVHGDRKSNCIDEFDQTQKQLILDLMKEAGKPIEIINYRD